jgi:hypothetical protein
MIGANEQNLDDELLFNSHFHDSWIFYHSTSYLKHIFKAILFFSLNQSILELNFDLKDSMRIKINNFVIFVEMHS